MSAQRIWQVTLAGQGWRFEATAPATVLQAAELAGIRLPSSCRNGTCRTCLCLAKSGTVRYLVDWPCAAERNFTMG